MKKIFHLFFLVSIGYITGILFAQKPGKKLREELKKAEKPCLKLFDELKKADKEFIDFAKDQIDKHLKK